MSCTLHCSQLGRSPRRRDGDSEGITFPPLPLLPATSGPGRCIPNTERHVSSGSPPACHLKTSRESLERLLEHPKAGGAASDALLSQAVSVTRSSGSSNQVFTNSAGWSPTGRFFARTIARICISHLSGSRGAVTRT